MLDKPTMHMCMITISIYTCTCTLQMQCKVMLLRSTQNVPQSNGSPAHHVTQSVVGSWCQTLHLMRSPIERDMGGVFNREGEHNSWLGINKHSGIWRVGR